jgi:hypothetical protein
MTGGHNTIHTRQKFGTLVYGIMNWCNCNKPWFYSECSWRKTKLQWLQDSSPKKGDNYNNLRHETSHTLRNKKRGYL